MWPGLERFLPPPRARPVHGWMPRIRLLVAGASTLSAEPTTGALIETAATLRTDHVRSEVLRALKRDWPVDRLLPLLLSENHLLVEATLVTLGAVGQMQETKFVASMLRHDATRVVAAAEQALWRLWMRGGSNWAVNALAQALEAIDDGDLEDAAALLADLTMAEPTFAEPHHQAGIVAALRERRDEAIAYYRQALRLNPHHFAAAVGLGQIYLERGQLERSREYYAYAVQIHPHLDDAAEILAGLNRALGGGGTNGHA
jgi:tetratricopeptide (TPR) repeat protein